MKYIHSLGMFYKSRTPGAKDKSPRKKRKIMSYREVVESVAGSKKMSELNDKEHAKIAGLLAEMSGFASGQHKRDLEKMAMRHQSQVSPMYRHEIKKGGVGSGVRGHTTERKPYPGEEAHKLNMPEKKDDSIITELPPEHYSDHENLKKLRKILKKVPGLQGHLGWDKKRKAVVDITGKASQLLASLARQ